MQTIMTLGGWKSTDMLQNYAYLSPGHLKKAALRTDAIFGEAERHGEVLEKSVGGGKTASLQVIDN